jgi:hypothetical protein
MGRQAWAKLREDEESEEGAGMKRKCKICGKAIARTGWCLKCQAAFDELEHKGWTVSLGCAEFFAQRARSAERKRRYSKLVRI